MQKHFNSKQANRIARYIAEEFGDQPEFLWENTPEAAIFRREDSGKWYGLIMKISRYKIDPENNSEINPKQNLDPKTSTPQMSATAETDSQTTVTILNVKLEAAEIADLLSEPGYFPAYHMNKTHWLTIALDETLSDERIMAHVEESWSLVGK